MSEGSIYKIVCMITGKSYVGQTRDTKTKDGKPYAYGVKGRWDDHVSCSSSTPLGEDITKYGRDAFKVESLEEHIPEDSLDEREAYWISNLGTMTPNGYNVMRHGRCRHRSETSLGKFYVPTTVRIRLTQICRNGEPHIIYAYLSQRDGSEVRLTFGQGKNSSYTEAISDASAFLESFADIPIETDPRILSSTATEYDTKLAQFDGINIQKIRVAKFNTLAAVYIDKTRICFGGKKTTYEQAVMKALSFAKTLHFKHPESNLIDDASKSATGGCFPSWGENLEGKTV